MQWKALWAGAALGLAACATVPPPAAPAASVSADANRAFAAYTEALLEDFWAEFPEFAFYAGNYRHADRMTVPDAAKRERNRAFYQRHLARLNAFDAGALSDSHRVDLVLIRNRLESNLWAQETFRAWQWQPSSYNAGSSLGPVLAREYAPLDTRLRHFLAKLAHVPAYYRAAMQNIADPTLEHTELAVIQNRGALNLLGADLAGRVESSGLSADEKALFARRLADARSAIEGYVAFLENTLARLKAGPARSFRIGAELYEQKFRFDIQSGISAADLHRLAMAEKAKHHDAMEKLARQLWPKYLGSAPMPADRLAVIRAVLDELAKRHTTADKFESTIREQIPALEKFVREKDLLDQDPTRPLLVRTMPPYMQGSGAGASISAPGPFDATAATWYNVEPLDKLPAADAESFLREYNDWMLQILNIHEAIPGHYTQLMHANKSPSKIKTLFGNGAMIEGWAVFSELVMLEAGYGDHAPEMWLTWMKWNLRSVVNTIIDYEIQTRNMSRDAALDMMIREAFQQQKEATEKWRRASFTQVQLTSYFSGYAEIRALRERERARLGKDFTVKGFNNKFLSYGNAPVRYIAELMAKEARY
ncbi:MAG: DUF885 domain-containing protein [Betaproteobacteria bacterium]|nr:DUF885 domain-containing protein [Betaproteobacteria bacterium]